jgi:hypothetical protein
VLQEKSLLQSQEVAELLRGHRASQAFCGEGDSAGYAQLAGSLAQFTAHWSEADMVAVAQNQVGFLCCVTSGFAGASLTSMPCF